MTDDVVRNKALVIERCLARVRDEFRCDHSRLDDQTIEDAIVLNLQRACESAIDLAMHVVASERLGVPQESREAFSLLEKAGRIDLATADAMRRMVGFRNIAVHEYQALSRPILISILENNLEDFGTLVKALLR
ncbi:MAG: DUF86 domain-containing protein [Candidatus Krumholzibacteriia bacterium]